MKRIVPAFLLILAFNLPAIYSLSPEGLTTSLGEVEDAIRRQALSGSYTNPSSLYSSFTFLDHSRVVTDTGLTLTTNRYFILRNQLLIRNDKGFFEFRIEDHDHLRGISLAVEDELFTHTPGDAAPKYPVFTPGESRDLLGLLHTYAGLGWLEQGQTSRAVQTWQAGSELGSADCVYYLGMYTLKQAGWDRSLKSKALAYLKKAGEMGLGLAWYQLGDIADRDGLQDQALKYYRLACDLGYSAGCLEAMLLTPDEE